MSDIMDRLRNSPCRGKCAYADIEGALETIEQQADEIERLRRAVAEATCHLSPAGCKAMNDAYKSSDNRASET